MSHIRIVSPLCWPFELSPLNELYMEISGVVSVYWCGICLLFNINIDADSVDLDQTAPIGTG